MWRRLDVGEVVVVIGAQGGGDKDVLNLHQAQAVTAGEQLDATLLTRLRTLDLAGLTRLRTLDVSENQLEGGVGVAANFPAICSDLAVLNMSTNRLTGNITDVLDGGGRLKYVNLSSNNFTGERWLGIKSSDVIVGIDVVCRGPVPHLISMLTGFSAGCAAFLLAILLSHRIRVLPGEGLVAVVRGIVSVAFGVASV
ncbi:hypothetical protein EJB05_07742, partial [Eragrostis curvula]